MRRRGEAGHPKPSGQAIGEGLTLWKPITVGIDEHGEPVTLVLPGRHFALGGETGGGKSTALQLLVAAAAFDPSVELVLFDGKLVELGPWERCASRCVWWDVDEAISLLDELWAECLRRLELIHSAPGIKRKVSPDDGLGLVLVAIDELALYCTAPRKAGQEFSNRLRLLVQVSRATGIIVVAATARPSYDVIPTSLRDLFPTRWAMRCPERGSSDIVLGTGWAARGYSAADIRAEDRGVGYLLHEGGVPRLVRACYLSDADLEVLIPRAEALRRPVLQAVGPEGASS